MVAFWIVLPNETAMTACPASWYAVATNAEFGFSGVLGLGVLGFASSELMPTVYVLARINAGRQRVADCLNKLRHPRPSHQRSSMNFVIVLYFFCEEDLDSGGLPPLATLLLWLQKRRANNTQLTSHSLFNWTRQPDTVCVGALFRRFLLAAVTNATFLVENDTYKRICPD